MPNWNPITSTSGITEQTEAAISNDDVAVSRGSNTESAMGTAGCVITVHMALICPNNPQYSTHQLIGLARTKVARHFSPKSSTFKVCSEVKSSKCSGR